MPERTYVLVLRVWRETDGRYVARVRGQLDPDAEPAFDRTTPIDHVTATVGEWLALVTTP